MEMGDILKCCIGIIIIVAVLVIIGNFWTNNELNTNMERINITENCSIEVPKGIEFDKSGGVDSKGAFIGLNGWKGGDLGKLWIDYSQPRDGEKVSGSNSTEPFDTERHDGNPGTFSCMIIVDPITNQKVIITGENPALVKKVAESVKFK